MLEGNLVHDEVTKMGGRLCTALGSVIQTFSLSLVKWGLLEGFEHNRDVIRIGF